MESSNKKTVLVIGSTGSQGRAFVRAFLDNCGPDEWQLRALTRNASSERAKRLLKRAKDANRILELVQGDVTNMDSVKQHMNGCHAMFLVLDPVALGGDEGSEKGVNAEAEIGQSIIDAAADSGIKHVVYSSVQSADRETGIPHFESKFRIEQHLRKSAQRVQQYNIVRPVYFMDNVVRLGALMKQDQGIFQHPLPPDLKLQMVSTKDIGRLSAKIVLSPQEFSADNMRAISLAIEEQPMRVYAERAGYRYQEIPKTGLNKDYQIMYKWFERTGYNADIDFCRRLLKEFDSWETFCRDQGIMRASGLKTKED